MYDFWFTLGASIMNPGFLEKAVEEAPPSFKRITRVTTEIDGTSQLTITNNVSAGLLEKCTAKQFRLALRAGLLKLTEDSKFPPPPPTSFYTVGRLSQMITTMDFMGSLAKAQQAYRDAAGTSPIETSAAFPAFLGLCLIDGLLRLRLNEAIPPPDALKFKRAGLQQFDDCPQTPEDKQEELKEILGEFDLSPNPEDPERKVISKFIELTVEVTTSLTGHVNDPWSYGCPDWIEYWSPQSDRVVS